MEPINLGNFKEKREREREKEKKKNKTMHQQKSMQYLLTNQLLIKDHAKH